MNTKTRTIIETAAFFSFACIISTITMLGFAGVDPFASDAPQVQTIANGNK